MQAGSQSERPQNDRFDVVAALRDAAYTALIALALFLPLIGFLTGVDGSNTLTLTTRWPLLFAFVAIIAVCRFVYSFAQSPRPAPAPTAAAGTLPQIWRGYFAKWFIPCTIGFVIAYPLIVFVTAGSSGGQKWIANFGIQILNYVMLGWGLNIVVGLAGLLDLGYVAFYAVRSEERRVGK